MRLLISVITVVLLILMTGCSSGIISDLLSVGQEKIQEAVDKIKSGSDAVGDADSAPGYDQFNFEHISSYMDLADAFSEIVVRPHIPKEEWIEYSYLFLEESAINGVQTRHVRVMINHGLPGSEAELWITENEGYLETVKAVIDGVEQHPPQIYNWYMIPLEGLLAEPGDLHSKWPGWELVSQSKQDRDLGIGPLEANIYELACPETQEIIVLSIAEIAKRNFMIGFERSDGWMYSNYIVTHLIPR